MEKKKLLIADSTETFCSGLKEILDQEFCIRIAQTGEKALEILDEFMPDIMMLDVMLSGLDGIGVLEYAAAHNRKTKTLVTISVRSEYIFTKLTQLQVSYALMKPCGLETAAERIRDIASLYSRICVPERNDLHTLTDILLELGLNPKHNGYHYLCSATALYAADSTQALTKELYVAVGKTFGVGWQQVERSIRAALEAAWKHRDDRVWHRWFSAGILSAAKRPTNGEVICRLAEHLQLEQTRKIG